MNYPPVTVAIQLLMEIQQVTTVGGVRTIRLDPRLAA
jgi:hypothetical protein